jgi:hypothetical protein
MKSHRDRRAAPPGVTFKQNTDEMRDAPSLVSSSCRCAARRPDHRMRHDDLALGVYLFHLLDKRERGAGLPRDPGQSRDILREKRSAIA